MSLNSLLDRFDALNSDLEESVKRAEAIADAVVGTTPEVAADGHAGRAAPFSLLSAYEGRLDRQTELGTRLRIALGRISEGVQGSERLGSTLMPTPAAKSGY